MAVLTGERAEPTSSDQLLTEQYQWEQTPASRERPWDAEASDPFTHFLSVLCELGAGQLCFLCATAVYPSYPYRERGFGSPTEDESARVARMSPGTIVFVGRRVELGELFRVEVPVVGSLLPVSEQTTQSEHNVGQVSPYADAIRWIRDNSGLTMESIAELVNVTRVRLHNWQNGERMTPDHQRHLLAVLHILQRAAALHSTRDQLTAWLYTPRGADARTPADLLRAGEFDRARLLAISTPSLGVKSPPAWVNESGPNGVPVWQERMAEASAAIRDYDGEVDEVWLSEGRPKNSRITRKR